MKDAEEKAREVVSAVVAGYGDEVFVQDGYGFYDDAIEAVAKALRAERRAALEEAVKVAEKWPNRVDTMTMAARYFESGGWNNAVAGAIYDVAAKIRALADRDAGGGE